ncbi:hypothetical protein POTOM_027291 [Populus tomentosa]|uniref:Uncharacterized protein n=1 Tax=Populus tomentosa TaxID=118781 RepID=A0A8X7ZIM6_POPTO|nr:hypothetical protein POTOM_027291 [Populus tomentosa]
MCTLELPSNHKINSFMSTRKEELDLLIDYIKDASRERVVVDLSAKVSSLSADISCRMVLGKKYMEKEFDEKGFKPVIHEGMRLAASFNLGDYIPPIAPLDLQGLTKRMKAVGKVFDDFFEKIIDEHIQFKDENRTKDFVDVMLDFLGSEETKYRIGRDNIKAIILDMLVGSMDTSATAIEWTLSELIKHPRFIPERFAGSNIDVRGRDFQLLPFGSGRRGCPGMHLGLTMVRQIVAQLVHCFDWELPNNMLPEELDMTEAFGLATPRANHLCATPTYRLHL